ncbi:phage tailspike protein [Xenorhabdus bovienii]|uniref:phage tailspike protein n=1 Tax=Xenorhabdus bovienii TaxID=40576 RepID=UPI0023B30451|nr:phage tailspike protein [Xenorhabdus bovienii]MDE9465105.1 phage head-binding domain-containing protein [Xenorhabdus bovienii]
MIELKNTILVPSQLITIDHAFNVYPNGNIYIGKIDTDPAIPKNQIQVYLEHEDGTYIPVPQPLSINPAGYPVYNELVAKFVTDQNHSMAVYDSCGSQQFYCPNILKYAPDPFSEKLKNNGGDKLVRSLFSDLFYSDYNLSIFKRAGNFRKGSVVKSKFDALLLDGKYYAYRLDVEHVVTELENIQANWVCVGLLNGYPVNDVRNFGAKADLVEKGIDATDCSDAWELCYLFCKDYGYAMVLPDAPIYVTKPCKAGNLNITSESGKAGFADPYYGRREDKTNFIDGRKSANWTYFYNYDKGLNKTWFDMSSIATGCLVCSDKDISILVKRYDEEFKLSGIGVLGNHRAKNQIGIDSGVPEGYEGVRSELSNISVVGCGSHGILFRAGFEISSPNGLNLYANNGYGLYVDAHDEIDSPVEYLTFNRIKADNNRLGGLGFKHIRVMVVFDDVIGNNSGQYDCPLEIDPLLKYWRKIPPTIYDNRAALIKIENGALNKVGDYGSIHNLTFRNIKGEQVVNLISANNKVGNIGSITKLILDNIHAVESSRLDSKLKGCVSLIDCLYLDDVQANNIYATKNIVKLEIDNVKYIKNDSGSTNIDIETVKQKALFKKPGTVIASGSTTNKKLGCVP